MKSKIIKKTKNPFLNREEVIVQITNDVTPTHAEAISAIGKDAELTVIKKINTNFGKQNFTVNAVVYSTKEDKEKIETVPQKVRKKLEAEKKAAEEAEKKAAEEAAKAEQDAKKAAEAAKATETQNPTEEETPVEVKTEKVKEELKSEEIKE